MDKIIIVIMFYKGCDGFGQTSFLVISEQNSLILSYKYHCHSKDNPGCTTTSGRWFADGYQEVSLISVIFHSLSLLLSLT